MSAALAHDPARDPMVSVAVATAVDSVHTEVTRALAHGRFRPVVQLKNADQLAAYVRSSPPDVLVLDLSLPGDSVRACARITRGDERIAVVMLSDSDDSHALFRALAAGAAGLVLLPFSHRQLPRVLDVVLAGELAFPRDLTTRAVRAMIRAGLRIDWIRNLEAAGLSPRQWQVLDLLADGLSTAEIADRLFISKVTVRTHVVTIVTKLHVSSRAEAIALAQSVRRNQRVDL